MATGSRDDNGIRLRFTVTGMTCASCSARVEKAVRALPFVREVSVNLLTGKTEVTVAEDGAETAEADICRAVEKAGYRAEPYAAGASSGAAAKAPTAEKKGSLIPDPSEGMKFRLIASAIVLIPLMYLSMGHMIGAPLPRFLDPHRDPLAFAFAQFLLVIPIVYWNRTYYIRGYRSLFRGAPNMDTLIAVGSSAAVAYGVYTVFRIGAALSAGRFETASDCAMNLYFESAAMILTLITLGKFFEARSKKRTGEAIEKLMDLAPKTAILWTEEGEREIPAEKLAVGDVVAVKPGAAFPADGEVVFGETTADESMITGESIPVLKQVGDKAVAATVNRTGYVRVRVGAVGEDTALAEIIRLVEDASSSKAPIARLADKVSGIFVPTVMAIALVVFALAWAIGGRFEFALNLGISVLVISCPCALGLATPVAIMVGTGKGAEYGILFKSADALGTMHAVGTVVFDKTGTITEGRPRVTRVYGDEQRSLALAAALEARSEHPLAEAVIAGAKERGIELPTADGFEAVPGRGIRGSVGGAAVLVGSAAFLGENGIETSDFSEDSAASAEKGETALFVAAGGTAIGMIAVSDPIKPTSAEAIRRLKERGVETVILTGDRRAAAEAVGRQVGADRIVAEVLPGEKEAAIAELEAEGKKVAMVGDGINDAPALARADVGIAIGAGTDVAIGSADVVLMSGDLLGAVGALELSRRTIRNIRENLFWAFLYNSIGIPIAAGALYPAFGILLSPMIGAAAMSLSSVCVVGNALRLKRFRPSYENKKRQGEEETEMKKIVSIEGMTCAHCSARVESALNALDGVTAKVDLKKKIAVVNADADDEAIRAAVAEAGYTVKGIEIKKGLFGR